MELGFVDADCTFLRGESVNRTKMIKKESIWTLSEL